MTNYIIGILLGIIGILYFDRAREKRKAALIQNEESLKEVKVLSSKIEENKKNIKEEEKTNEEFKPKKKSVEELANYFNNDNK